MRIEFTKMHGSGNDFVVFESTPEHNIPHAEQLRKLANRHTGIGFDQALVLEKPRRAGTVVFYRIFNSDGAEVEQCGNGARCIAALLHRRGQTRSQSMTLDSPAGLVQARVSPGGVSVNMGIPDFHPASLPFETASESDTYRLEVAGETVEFSAVSLGNPHAVLNVGSVDEAPVQRLGPALERHARFPNRVNVGFLQIVDRSHVRLRVYERGAGETLACGTGACAAVAVGHRRGQLDPEVSVSVRGGELRVNWPGPGENIWLTGPAEVSFEGHVEV